MFNASGADPDETDADGNSPVPYSCSPCGESLWRIPMENPFGESLMRL